MIPKSSTCIIGWVRYGYGGSVVGLTNKAISTLALIPDHVTSGKGWVAHGRISFLSGVRSVSGEKFSLGERLQQAYGIEIEFTVGMYA
jgi:hypothetical protein